MERDGPGISGLDKDDITAQEELAAFDQLGPLTRRVIDEKMCVRWSSHQTLQVIKTLWRSNPLNPETDHSMADMLLTMTLVHPRTDPTDRYAHMDTLANATGFQLLSGRCQLGPFQP